MSVDEVEQQLVAKIDDARSIITLLKAVYLRESAVVVASSDGLRVTVEESKCLQANAFIQAELFQTYILTCEMICFKMNLTVCLECLNMFTSSHHAGSSTALEMRYAGVGHPLVLVLEEDGVVTDCSIETMVAEDTVTFNLENDHLLNKVILRSECLKEFFYEIDGDGDIVDIFFNSNPAYLEFISKHVKLTSKVRVGSSSDLVEMFECRRDSQSHYRHRLLKLAAKPLSQSHKISLRIDSRNFLCLQFMILMEEDVACFVEFYCSPEED